MSYTGDDLAILVPVWRRTTNLPRLVTSVIDTVPDAEVWFVVNSDDTEAHGPVDELRRDVFGSLTTAMWPVVDWPGGARGDYARKINAGYRACDRPVLFTGADDIEFVDGWYEAARPLLSDELDVTASRRVGVVGTVDECNDRTATGDLSTHSLVARWYADLGGAWGIPSTIYYEGYHHDHVDDELCEVARHRGVYAHAFDSIVRHHHPNAGRAPDDETYQRGRANTRATQAEFRRRRRLWNPTNAQPGVVTVHR